METKSFTATAISTYIN